MKAGGSRLRGALAAVAFALVGVASGAAHADPEVTELRIGEHPDMTRVVIDVSSPVTYKIFMLPDPYRVVIDLPEVTWEVPPGAGDSGAGLVKGYRTGLFAPGTWRIVLDVQAPVRVKKAFLLDPREGHQYRFVLDLEQVTREAFLQDLRAAPQAAPRTVPAPPVAPQDATSENPVFFDPIGRMYNMGIRFLD